MVERQRELRDVRESLDLLRARQAVEPLTAAAQRLYDELTKKEQRLVASQFSVVGAA